MDKEDLQKIIADYYSRLSPKLQQFFASMGWLETLSSISDRNNLNVTQLSVLSTETAMFLLGVTHREDYEKELAKGMELPDDKLKIILDDVDSFILKSIKSELSDAYYINAIINEELEKEIPEAALIEGGLDERFKTLDPKIQKIVQDSNYQVKIYSIGKRNNLTIAQITELEEVITETLLGTIPTDKFEEELKRRASLPNERVDFIINEVNEKILREVRYSILSLNKENSAGGVNKLELNKPISSRLNINTEAEKKLVPIEITEKEAKDEQNISTIIGQKMNGSFALPKINTEYSIGKMTSELEKQKANNQAKSWDDPYRLNPGE